MSISLTSQIVSSRLIESKSILFTLVPFSSVPSANAVTHWCRQSSLQCLDHRWSRTRVGGYASLCEARSMLWIMREQSRGWMKLTPGQMSPSGLAAWREGRTIYLGLSVDAEAWAMYCRHGWSVVQPLEPWRMTTKVFSEYNVLEQVKWSAYVFARVSLVLVRDLLSCRTPLLLP